MEDFDKIVVASWLAASLRGVKMTIKHKKSAIIDLNIASIYIAKM